MGIRPSLGMGVGLHHTKFPEAWPCGIGDFPIPGPDQSALAGSQQALRERPLTSGFEMMTAHSVKLLRDTREYFGLDSGTGPNVIGNVFMWPDDECAVPNWLIMPITVEIGGGHSALYGLAATYKRFRGMGNGGFVPLPTYSPEKAFEGIYYHAWDTWNKAGRPVPDFSKPDEFPFWKESWPYIVLVEWCTENNQCYDIFHHESMMWTGAFQYIMAKAGVDIAIRDLRLGVYMRWS